MAFKKEKNGFSFGLNYISDNYPTPMNNVLYAKIYASFLLTDLYDDCMLIIVRKTIDYCSMISL